MGVILSSIRNRTQHTSATRFHTSLFFLKRILLLQYIFVVLIFGFNASAFAASANLSWDSNTEPDLSGYKVYFGTSSGNYGAPVNVGNTTSYTVSGLGDGTYYFVVTAFDTAGNESGFSNEASKTFSSSDTTPPVISAISVSNVLDDRATISWATNEAADTQIEYGTTTSYGTLSPLNTAMLTAHTGTLTGLSSETLYHYRVLSRDAAGNLTTSGDGSFTTTAGPDITPPAISGIGSSNAGETRVTISWTTSEAADTRIEYGTTTSYGSFTALSASLVTAHSQDITGLSAGTTYHFRVLSKDAAANLATSGNNTFTTDTPPGDTDGPVISGISVGSINASGATVTWSTDEGATSQVEYGTTSSYGTSSALSSTLVTTHSRSLSGLSASTVYHYRVVSKDASDNISSSGDGTFTTAGASSDTTGPVISNVDVQNITAGSATLTWTTDESATSQVDFGLTDSYGSSTSKNETLLTSHQQIITGLSANTSYHFRVKSGDAGGNLSASNDASFQTAVSENSDTTPPADVASFAASGSREAVVLSWTNPSDSDFAGVRIRFRTDDFPNDINDGELLGDISGDPGAAMAMTHSGLAEGVTYYYLAAAYDDSGNFQTTVFASAKTSAPASRADSGSSSGGGGGCGMIRPGGGEPPKPGDAAAMLSLIGLLSLMVLKKGFLKAFAAESSMKIRTM